MGPWDRATDTVWDATVGTVCNARVGDEACGQLRVVGGVDGASDDTLEAVGRTGGVTSVVAELEVTMEPTLRLVVVTVTDDGSDSLVS